MMSWKGAGVMWARKSCSAVVAAALIPALLGAASVAGAPARARLVTCTLKVIDRNGHRVAPVDTQLFNPRTDFFIDFGQATSRQVRAGRYNLASWIPTGSGAGVSYTLEDFMVSLTSNRTLVLDARRGRPVRVSIDNPRAVNESVEVALVISGDNLGSFSAGSV